jgi:hypothetical protein
VLPSVGHAATPESGTARKHIFLLMTQMERDPDAVARKAQWTELRIALPQNEFGGGKLVSIEIAGEAVQTVARDLPSS